jgi:hypothetical protein
MDQPVARHHVGRPGRPVRRPGERRQRPAGLLEDQLAGRDVPRGHRVLAVGVELAARDGAQRQRR